MTEKNQSKHILIVDDSADQQFLLKMLLEARGYTTDCTPNGKEALTLLRSNKKKPQTILLDLNMKIMGGLEFLKQQCADPLLRDIPVIVLSGESESTKTCESIKSDVLSKPFSIAALLEALARIPQLH